MSRVQLSVALGALALALSASVSAQPSAIPKLTGTVGPGYTITLKSGTRKVSTLKAGKYRLVIRDKSSDHDFHLAGRGFDRVLTSTEFVGTKTLIIRLRKGRYTYVCDPHTVVMKGSFRVR